MEISTENILPPEAQSAAQPKAKNEAATAAELKKAAEDFEAIFLKQFLGQALKPLLHNTLGSQATGAGVYQHMITDVIAENLSQGGDFGFSTMLQVQLMGDPESDLVEEEKDLEEM